MDINDQRDYAEEAANRALMREESEGTKESGAINGFIPSVTQWACQCCTLVMANGECGEDCHNVPPLSEIPNGARTTLGMPYEEHSEDCLRRTLGSDAPGDYECDCERFEFSWRWCDGCDSNLGGSRHAFVVWTPAEKVQS